MIGPRATLALGGAAMLLSGCVAAAVPVAAAGAIGKHRMDRKHGKAAQEVPPMVLTPIPGAVALPAPDAVPPGMQYLYGSGEAAALSIQSYFHLADFLIGKSSDRAIGHAVSSVVLAPGATLDAPKFMPCGDKPLAVVLDVDETALLNLGFEADQTKRGGAYSQRRWDDWERTGATAVAPVPGAEAAIKAARMSNIAVVYNSNRMAANAAGTAAAIDGAGLGPAVHGDTLWLQGDAGTGSGKDARRWAISAKYCVVAMVGDQLGDFSDLFNAPGLSPAERRADVALPKIELLWGQGWFMLPNPVYGTALKGGFDQVFPDDKRWTDPAETAAPAPADDGSSN